MRRNYQTQKPDKKGKKNLLRAIIKTFRYEYSISFMIGFIKTGIDMLSPFLIQKIIVFLQTPDVDNKDGYLLVVFLISSQFVSYMM